MITLLQAIVPIIVALVGIIPTIISNRKKTEQSLKNTTEAIEKRVDKIQGTLDAHIKEDEDAKARTQRYRILRFYDEMCAGQRHSESHFEDILDSIDDYRKYCTKHPDFKNSRGEVAMEYIKTSYARIKSEGAFLIHKEEEEHAE